MKIYTAGPDVFYYDAPARFMQLRLTCQQHGHIALTPVDTAVDLNDPAAAQIIYAANINMIQECDAVVANGDNFRGMEPDSGTCFEIGYASALGKKIVIYYQYPAGKTLIDRLGTDRFTNTFVENFNLPMNLMLAKSSSIIEGTFEDAVKLLNTLL